jgi:hypothetical protein
VSSDALNQTIEMYFLDCRYNLRGLTEHRCPECGRKFDPTNTNTYANTEQPYRWFKLWNLDLMASLSSVLIVVSVILCSIAAWLHLGHWRRPSIDDPKFIGIDWIYIPSAILVYLGSLIALPLSFVMVFLIPASYIGVKMWRRWAMLFSGWALFFLDALLDLVGI